MARRSRESAGVRRKGSGSPSKSRRRSSMSLRVICCPKSSSDPALPVSGRCRLARVPEVKRRRAQPEVEVRRWVGVADEKSEIDSIEVHRDDPVDERPELERHDVDPDTDLSQVGLQHLRRALAARVPLLCQQGELHRPAAAVLAQAVAVPVGKPESFQQRLRALQVVVEDRQVWLEPGAVAGCDRPEDRLGQP